MSEAATRRRLAVVTLDPQSIGRGGSDQEHERQVAIYDLIEDNSFRVVGDDRGPYALTIALHEARLGLDIRAADGTPVIAHILSLTPFRPILKDYFLVCESYFTAIRTATPAQIEAIDASRRALHNEGAKLVGERLEGKVEMDFDTQRRLFTLITALHWRG